MKLPIAQQQSATPKLIFMRSVPLTVWYFFDRPGNQVCCDNGMPVCHCTAANLALLENGGRVREFDGHFCLTPVEIAYARDVLHGSNPLPFAGSAAKKAAIGIFTNLTTALNVLPLSPLHS